MKKILLLILSLVLIISLASCEFFNILGITTTTKESTAEANTSTTTQATTTTASNENDDDPIEDQYSYYDFTDGEKALYTDLIGEVIPFIPNNEYYVEEYSIPLKYVTIKGLLFLTYDNTQEEYDAYRELFSKYESLEYTNDLGEVCYAYWPADNSYFAEMSYGETEGRYTLQLTVYVEVKGGTEGIGTGIPYDELFTNEGAGLPSDADGVYDVDFTKGEYIKDVTNQGEYIDGCAPTGSPAVLVIPVQFSDVTAESKGFTLDALVEAFSKGGKTDYYSVYDYYYISSYGQLTLDVTVLDFWFTPEYDSTYYDQFSFMYEEYELEDGEQLILNEALDYLDDFMDLSQFDSDGNGTIDSVVLVSTLEINEADLFTWAFRYMNFYMNEDGSYYEYDGVHAKDYMWLSYQFLYEIVDEYGATHFDNISGINTCTFIHEFGHVLGLHDYYDYTGINIPIPGLEMMSTTQGDHNAYSKINLGWITTSRLVVTDSSITLTLENFSKNGDTIILANNWDDKLGAYQEYYIVVYRTANALNAFDNYDYGIEGVLVYHVNSAMYMQEGKDHYDVYNTNNDVIHEYGTENNLLESVFSANGELAFGVGDTMPTTIDDYGNELIYNFTVDEITSEYATITFTVK